MKTISKEVFDKGFILTLVLSIFFLYFFFGKLTTDINHKYYGAGSDGLQAYYHTLYHVKHDSSYWHSSSVNYPYGEQVVFTGCQPLLTNTIKVISKVIDISDYTLGMINIIMLSSIIFSALFIYLIFKHFKVTTWFGAISAVGIAFMSPQIIRIGGHYSLAYQCAIPLFILLLLKFYSFPSFKKSTVIGLFVFFMAGTHLYFFSFFAIIALCFWTLILFQNNSITENKFAKRLKFCSVHGFIQLIIPFVLIQIIMISTNHIHDRTNHPWGFFTFVTNLAGVFYSNNKIYTPFLDSFIKPLYPPTTVEGNVYAGLFATTMIVLLIIIAVKQLVFFKLKKVLIPINQPFLTAMFWAGIFGLVISFGYPFSLKGKEWLLDYAGPLNQFRGISRFAWIFYYAINIVAIYKVDEWLKQTNKYIKTTLMLIPICMISIDAYSNCNGFQDLLNNKIPRLDDVANKLPEDQWLQQLNVSKYQAIIGLPTYHVGSENLWIAPETKMVEDIIVNCLKTGLSTTMVFSSRVSLSQTYKNAAMVKEPYRDLEIVNDFKNNKPFLVLVRENELNAEEKELLKLCTRIKDTPLFSVYELEVKALKNKADNLYEKTEERMKSSKLVRFGDFLTTDSVQRFIYNGFENENYPLSFIGHGAHQAILKDGTELFRGQFANYKDEEYLVSFWMENYTRDVYPRTWVFINYIDAQGTTYYTDAFNIHSFLKALDGNWGLIERKIKLRSKDESIAISAANYDLYTNKDSMIVDELMIRPISDTLYKPADGKYVFMNNRRYLKK